MTSDTRIDAENVASLGTNAPGVPIPKAHIMVMVAASSVHSRVYGQDRWQGIAGTYALPAGKLGYKTCIIRFPATAVGRAMPTDCMGESEIEEFEKASPAPLWCPFVPYMLLPPPGTNRLRNLISATPRCPRIFYDGSRGVSKRAPDFWATLKTFHRDRNTQLGLEPVHDVGYPDEHQFPCIATSAYVMSRQNGSTWADISRRRTEWFVICDITLDKDKDQREQIVSWCRARAKEGWSPVVLADHAVNFNIRASELVGPNKMEIQNG